MKSELLGLAAIIIIVRAAYDWFAHERRIWVQTVERAAVQAEFSDYREDPTESQELQDSHHKFHRERQDELKLRYPQHLISEPHRRYFEKAKIAERAQWRSLMLQYGLCLTFLILYHLYKWLTS